MIQDIYPHNFDIGFVEGAVPSDDSGIMLFFLNKILVWETDGSITYPDYKDVKDFVKNPGYLFRLDDREFYRVHLETEKEKEAIENALLEKCEKGQPVWAKRAYFREHGPKELTLASITAMHLEGWYGKNIFCGACGKKLEQDKKERALRCPNCGNMVYPRINPAVIVGVIDGDKMLLTKYNGREYKKYALIAGFNEIGESLEETVRREVLEEAGLKVKNIRYYKSQPWGFSDNILAGYYCEVDGDSKITIDSEELSVAKWVSREEIPTFLGELSLTEEMMEIFRIDKVF